MKGFEDILLVSRLTFCLNKSVFDVEILRFKRSHLFTVALIVRATGVLPWKWSPVTMS